MKKLISVIMTMIMVMSMGTIGFAEGNNGKITKVYSKVINELIVEENGSIDIVKLDESERYRTSKVINEKGQIEATFIVDKEKNTLYSSITGKTIQLEEIKEEINSISTKAGGGSFYKTTKMSYSKIADAVGTGITAATVAGMLVAALTAPWNIELVATVGDMISTSWTAISDNVIKKKSGGIAVDIWKDTRKIFKQGKYHNIDYAYVKKVYRY